MQMPLTRYGLREIILLLLLLAAVGLTCWLRWPGVVWPWLHIALLCLLAFGLAFFRDPQRRVPAEQNVLLAPADGKVTDISNVEENEFLGCSALRIGIFLSVLDVHINRSPCAGRVAYVKASRGRCINAMRWRMASAYNRANNMGLDCPDHPAIRVLVRQITGAIARRIVCQSRPGDALAAGEPFGMIKFGSRTELFCPADEDAQVVVKVGDKVRAGASVLVRYRQGERAAVADPSRGSATASADPETGQS